jgi:hypothetical protein
MSGLESPARFYVSASPSLRTPPIITGPLRRASLRYLLAFGPWLSILERELEPLAIAIVAALLKQFMTKETTDDG